jgi:hypothetical protein
LDNTAPRRSVLNASSTTLPSCPLIGAPRSVLSERRLLIFAADSCALTLKPFETPVCTADGTTYDLLSIIPFIRQHGTDPVTGKKLAAGDLIKLNFAKNNDGVRLSAGTPSAPS